MPIDVHVQILDLPRLPERSTTGMLSNVVIQGSFSLTRRRYEQIFSELIQSLAGESVGKCILGSNALQKIPRCGVIGE